MPTLRRLTIDDYEAMLELWQHAGLSTIKPTGRDSRSEFEKQFAGGQIAIGLEEDGQLIGVVMATGVIGRYIFGLVPAQGGRATELEDLAASFERLRAFAAPELAHAGPSATALLDRATSPVQAGSILTLFLRFPFESAGLRLRLRALRRRFPDEERFEDLRRALVKLLRLRWQLRFYGSLKALLRGWRVFHATMAIFLVLALTAHIAVSLYLGYGLQ